MAPSPPTSAPEALTTAPATSAMPPNVAGRPSPNPHLQDRLPPSGPDRQDAASRALSVAVDQLAPLVRAVLTQLVRYVVNAATVCDPGGGGAR
jgi:hypothetical protein